MNGFQLAEALNGKTEEEQIALLKKYRLVRIIEDTDDLRIVLNTLASTNIYVVLAKGFLSDRPEISPVLVNLVEQYPTQYLAAYFMLKKYEESSRRFSSNKQEIAAARWFKSIITGSLDYDTEDHKIHQSSSIQKDLNKLFKGVDVFQLLNNNSASTPMLGSK